MIETTGRFLIVDDEPDMCWALENILKESGISSVRAPSGREALKLMDSNSFKLVILDAKLPDMDGLDLARLILKLDASVPIVMVSGYFYRDDVDIRNALAAGLIRGFIGKPFLHDDIRLEIETALSSRGDFSS